MSDRLDDILVMNLIKMGGETFGQHHSTSGTPRLSRSTSFYSPISKKLKLSPTSEDLTPGWPSDIWSETLTSKQPFSSRSDRSMSLTEAGSLAFSNMKTNEVPPPPGFPPLNSPVALPSNRYKTELCRSFQESGVCKYGNKCQFAHGEAELRGLYRHPKYKTEACRTFYNFGYCPYGARCHFIHEEKPALQHHSQAPAANQPRLLRQSVSFAGFLASRSSPPPAVSCDSLGFTRARSVSPPPVDLLSPVFSESGTQSVKSAFQFCQSRPSLSDIHHIPQIIEPPKSSSSCCVCGHGNNNTANSPNKFYIKEERNGGYTHQPMLQRSPSEDSLSDRDSYSSTGSTSGSESPTFDGLSKRLIVFERLSLSD